ncbi:MAG: TIGR02996 domain-containing protein [Myxococcales bacterium]|nr:TIGR02996 domain-containing protein [Myxococcales bacterium]
MLRALVALGDPRQLVAMRELAASPRARRATVRDYLARALPNAIAQLEAVSVSSIDDEQRWRALLPARDDAARDGRSASELLAAIYQDPDDDDSRRVYADLLQEAGDPRGELIGLQLQQARGAASSKEERRVRALLRAHRGQWIGEDLERVLNKVVFERGFLFAAELAQNAVATDEIWQRAAADERLATLRELHKGRGSARRLQLFVEGAARNLTSLEVPSNTILDVLVGLPGPRALQALSLPRPPSRKKLAAMVEASSLANLRRLTLTIDPGDIERVLGDLRRYRLLERLQALTLQPSGYQVEDGPAVMRLWAELPVKLSYLAYGHEHARFVIERRADGRCIARCVGWAADFAAAFASALPGEVRELVFTPCKHGGPTPEKQAIAAATRGRVEPLEVRFEGY